MTTYNTLLLDQEQWDLVLDSSGNIAIASPPYSLAQDVASAIRLFKGELWYNTGKGIPYFKEILGEFPPVSVLTGHMEKAAMSVPGVVSARCIVFAINDREVRGELKFIDESGVKNAINF